MTRENVAEENSNSTRDQLGLGPLWKEALDDQDKCKARDAALEMAMDRLETGKAVQAANRGRFHFTSP